MATIRMEESEWWSKRQRTGVRKEGGDEFKASPTRGRIKEEKLLRKDGRGQEEIDVSKNSQRPQQQD